jgi:hypothetical protein
VEARSIWLTWRPVGIAAAASVPLLLLAGLLAGAGHGTLAPLLVLFPLGPLAALARGVFDPNNAAGIAAALLQWPAYAMLLRAGARMGRFRIAAGCVAVLHLLAMAVAASRML